MNKEIIQRLNDYVFSKKDDVKDDWDNLLDYINELETNRDKAIEYIEEHCSISENTGKCICVLNNKRCNESLEILRGNKKEGKE